MMQHATVVEEADHRKKRRARKNADGLLARRRVRCDQHRQREAEVNGHTAKQGNRFQMHFARPGLVHKAGAQGKAAHGHGQSSGGEKRDEKRQQITVHQSFPSVWAPPGIRKARLNDANLTPRQDAEFRSLDYGMLRLAASSMTPTNRFSSFTLT